MTREEIDVIEKEWFGKLLAATQQCISDQASAMAAAGHDASEIHAALSGAVPRLTEWLAARRKDIRAIIVSGKYGLTPVTATGEQLRAVPRNDNSRG